MSAPAAGMPDAARRGAWLAFGVAFVAVAMVRFTAFPLGEDYELPRQLLYPMVMTGLIALPWAIAGRAFVIALAALVGLGAWSP